MKIPFFEKCWPIYIQYLFIYIDFFVGKRKLGSTVILFITAGFQSIPGYDLNDDDDDDIHVY